MSSDTQPARKTKANTACNACRARKTRCDGEKPSCSYCRTTGGQCVYRVAVAEHAVLLNEQSILDRLDRLESRTGALADLSDSWSRSHQALLRMDLRPDASQDKKTPYAMTPFFHTASSHKMLRYWPRINMSLTLAGVNPLKYVEETEGAGIPYLAAMGGSLAGMGLNAEIDAATVDLYFAQIQDNCTGLDLLLSQLLKCHSSILFTPLSHGSPMSVAASTTPASSSGGSDHRAGGGGGNGSGFSLNVGGCTCQLLLAIALAAKGAYAKSCHNMADLVAKDVHEQAFRQACAQMGELFFASDDDSILFLILGAHLLMSEAYPAGALKLIQAAGDRLGRCGRRQVNEPWWIERFKDCLKLHHVIESDILLTMDGLPSEAAFALMNSLPTTRSMREVETLYQNMSVAEIAKNKLIATQLDGVLSLSNIQNSILVQMYTIEQAYSQPSLLAKSLTELKADLTHWFDNMPLEWHFPRDLTGAMTIPKPNPDLLGHLRLKYYVLEFLMCRPILYYITHESFEAPMDTSPSSPGPEGRPFWVYDACHRCLQCACLIVLGDETPMAETSPAPRDWFELHMVWGAALTLVLALATPSLAKFLPKHGQQMDVPLLVAKAESVLLQAAEESSVAAHCLSILCNVEKNLLGGSHASNGANGTRNGTLVHANGTPNSMSTN